MPELIRLEGRDSSGNAVSFDLPVTDQTVFGPVSIRKGNEVAALGLDPTLTPVYPTWARTLGQDQSLQSWLATLAPNQIPVLPEDETPWWIDTAQGFAYPGVNAITEGATKSGSSWVGGTKRTVSSRNDGWATFWRLGAAGLAGLGPGAQIVLGSSSWTSPAQVRSELHHGTDGNIVEKVGCQEKALECRGGYVGNFTMTGRSVGGGAYNLIHTSGNVAPRLERLLLRNSQGGAPSPNTEAGALSGFPPGTVIRNVRIEGAMSSPIMANGSTGVDTNLLLENVYVDGADQGMIALWQMYGTTTFRNVHAVRLKGGGVNVELTQAGGMTLDWQGGSIMVDKPAPETGYYNCHVKIGESQNGSAKINLSGVETDKGPWSGSLSVQMWGNMGKQRAADVTCDTKPVRFTDNGVFAAA